MKTTPCLFPGYKNSFWESRRIFQMANFEVTDNAPTFAEFPDLEGKKAEVHDWVEDQLGDLHQRIEGNDIEEISPEECATELRYIIDQNRDGNYKLFAKDTAVVEAALIFLGYGDRLDQINGIYYGKDEEEIDTNSQTSAVLRQFLKDHTRPGTSGVKLSASGEGKVGGFATDEVMQALANALQEKIDKNDAKQQAVNSLGIEKGTLISSKQTVEHEKRRLRGRFQNIPGEIQELEGEIQTEEGKTTSLRAEIERIKQGEVTERMKTDFSRTKLVDDAPFDKSLRSQINEENYNPDGWFKKREQKAMAQLRVAIQNIFRDEFPGVEPPTDIAEISIFQLQEGKKRTRLRAGGIFKRGDRKILNAVRAWAQEKADEKEATTIQALEKEIAQIEGVITQKRSSIESKKTEKTETEKEIPTLQQKINSLTSQIEAKEGALAEKQKEEF